MATRENCIRTEDSFLFLASGYGRNRYVTNFSLVRQILLGKLNIVLRFADAHANPVKAKIGTPATKDV
jgi:hypothetical protein